MCKASIIIPAYNAEHYIEKTINSILHQDYSDYEVIVVNDGSTDSTEDKVRALAQRHPKVKCITLPNSGGPAKPRNVGIDYAKGEYIFIFDADDLMLPGKLQRSIACLDASPAADLLFTNFSTIDAEDNILNENFLDDYDSLWNLIPGLSNDCAVIESAKIHPALIRVNFIGTSSVVLRKSSLDAADKFDESLRNSDDRLFWMLFSMNHNFVFLNHILHQYRILPGSISNQGFIRRGPSKIRALKQVMNRVSDHALKMELSRQISNDYATLAYSFKKNSDYKNQQNSAWESIKYSFNGKALKLFLHAFVKGIFKK